MPGFVDVEPINPPGGPGDPPPVPPAGLAGQLVPSVVYRLINDVWTPVPNVVCLSVSARVGAEPWSARFRYRFDQRAGAEWPNAVEHIFALANPGDFAGHPYVFEHGDRILVKIPKPDGSWICLFDGFVRMPQADLNPSAESVTFEAFGTPERLWDFAVGGALVRDASEPGPTGAAIQTDLPTRFNPDGRPNCTREGADHTFERDVKAPIFIDPAFVEAKTEIPPRGRAWSLYSAARYLIVRGNAAERWVRNPDLDALRVLLSSVKPAASYAYIDWTNPASYKLEPIIIQDFDATGLPWPEALETMLRPHGFGLAFFLDTTPTGLPSWRLVIRRNDDNTFWKTLGLQARGASLDTSRTAVDFVRIQRDGLGANQVRVDCALDRVEASFLLAPLFRVDPEDVLAINRPKFIRGEASFDPIAYRVFGLDESGEGHWNFSAGRIKTDPPNLRNAFDPDGRSRQRVYVDRRRKPFRQLVSQDRAGNPKDAQLWIAVLTSETGVPGVFNPNSALSPWQQVTEGGWRLLPDRVGIEITAEDARNWRITGDAPKPVIPSGVLDVVRSMAAPSTAIPRVPRVVFRLTCVVEADRGIKAVAERRPQSPTAETIERRVDARDRFAREVWTRSSVVDHENASLRDDTEAAQAYAEALRREHEAIRFAGMLRVPRITLGIQLCDKLIGIPGRDLYFGTYLPGTQEGDRYPMVVGIEWDFSGEQSTRILLADRRAEVS